MSTTAARGSSDKGRTYIQALDEALCNGRWSELPELTRKVDKHAPERSSKSRVAPNECLMMLRPPVNPSGSGSDLSPALTLTARAEAHLAARDDSDGGSGLERYVRQLKAAIEADQFDPDDTFCARVCLADIYRRQGHAAEALAVLPDDVQQQQEGEATIAPLGWLEVCQAKSTYIRAHALDTTGAQEDEVKAIHRSATQRASVGSRTPALRKWNEKLLFRAAMSDFHRVQDPSIDSLSESLTSFRAWTSFGQRTADQHAARGFVGVPRRQVWGAHYELVSNILQRNYTYNPSGQDESKLLVEAGSIHSGDLLAKAKLQQFAELKQVERAYEAMIMEETQFPTSSESNTEVEEWVHTVTENWRVLCGPNWTDAELGEGGKQAHTRAVLDILYRAATKTFHSTAILRHLFIVHAWLGEFKMAMHAFRSYEEIVTRGKARAEKTGKHEIGFDSDDTAILTATEAVRILCRYGDYDEAEAAVEVGNTIERWLGQKRPQSADRALEKETTDATIAQLLPTSIAAAQRAIGIASANWARHTHDTDARAQLQSKAIDNLRRAQTSDPSDVPTAYALARTLAESKDIPGAMSVIRQCISFELPDDASTPEEGRARQLIPLWHLLALCLSAKDEYESALKACQAAWEQFDDVTILFGNGSSSVYGDALPRTRSAFGLVDQMSSLEKQGLIEIKLTELSLAELIEGPTAAVDSADDILSLYTRLYGRHGGMTTLEQPKVQQLLSPGSPTERSARPKSNRSSILQPHRNSMLGPKKDKTDGDAVSVKSSHFHLPFRSKSARKSVVPSTDNDVPPVPSSTHPPVLSSASIDNAVGYNVDPSASARQPLREMKHDLPHDKLPPPSGHAKQPPRQDTRLPGSFPGQSSSPETGMGSLQDHQQRTTLLAKVWLFIAGLYTRAEMLQDAAGAVEEAAKLAASHEAEKAGEHSSARHFAAKGWGGGKSVDELWADVLCAKGELAQAKNLTFDAAAQYEAALARDPDHQQSSIGLSDLLMDIYEQKMPAERPREPQEAIPPPPATLIEVSPNTNAKPADAASKTQVVTRVATVEASNASGPTPAELNRLAARDRAYLLLSSLTSRGAGWDDSQAWYSLARSYELSSQLDRAKQALWWVVSLEDHRPVRSWLEASVGGYTV